MSPLRVGALFAGYGGLEQGLAMVLDTELAWVAEIDEAPAKILAHHHPDVPNLGDVTKVEWSAVEPVDVITGGSPCQDLSHAGKRAGMKAGTRSGLWASMCDAVDIIRPRLVIWENVRGALSAPADSAVEPCPLCVGDGRGTHLRALGRVLGDLAELGYDARWYGLRAADVGAAHGRFRVFVIAAPANAERKGRGSARGAAPRPAARRRASAEPRGAGGLHPAELGEVSATLLPTPRAAVGMNAPLRPHALDTSRLEDAVAVHLLPTPRATDGEKARRRRSDGSTYQADGYERDTLSDAALSATWGDYAPAVARWEAAIGRPAPAPTEVGPKGTPRLSARFVEWMMGLPEGHVTDVRGVGRNPALKALGNGVVPQQAAAAILAYLEDEAADAERAAVS